MAIEFGAILKLKDEFTKVAKAANDKTTMLGKSIGGVKKVGGIAFKGLLIGGAAAVGIMGASVKKFADFESAMLDMKSVYDPSEIPDGLYKNMTDQAKQLGASTKFSAQEAAQGMKELAAAGMKPDQVMKAIAGTLDLAAAGEMEVAAASEIVSNGLNMFGMSADKAGHFADVLAKAGALGSLSVEDMGNSLKYVGPVAAAAGYSLESVSGALVALSNNGIKGEQGGTVLRGILTNLVAPSIQAAKQLKTLGMTVTDAAGRMKPMSQIVDDFKNKTANLTESQRLAAATTLVGKTNLAGFLALVKTGGATIDKYTNQLIGADGAAKAMAAIKMGGLSGAWELMMGSIDGVFISLGERLAPAMVSFSSLMSKIADGTNGIFKIADAWDLVSQGMNGPVVDMKEMQGLLDGFNMFTGFDIKMPDFMKLTTGFGTMSTSFQTMLSDLGTSAMIMIQPILDAFGINATSNVDLLSAAFTGLGATFTAIGAVVAFLAPIVGTLVETIIAIAEPIIAIVTPAFQSLMQTIAEAQPLWDFLGSTLVVIGGILGNVIGVAIAWTIMEFQRMIAILNVVAKVAGPPLTAVFKAIGEGVSKVAGFISGLISKVQELIKSFSNVKVPSWVSSGVSFAGNLLGGGKKATKKFSGISNVTRDEMPALLHKGERVLTRDENRRFSESNREQGAIMTSGGATTNSNTTIINMGGAKITSTSGNKQDTINKILEHLMPQLEAALDTGGRA